MRKALLLCLSLLFLQAADPAMAKLTVNCAKPTLESERLLCQASAIKARRVQTTIGAAVLGALLGNLTAQQSGGNRTTGTVAGAVAGGLTGYWLNLQNEIAAKNASQTARAAEIKARASSEAKRQRTSATNLHAELKTVLLRSPSAGEDPARHQEELAQIAQAADIGLRQAQQSAQGYTSVGQGLGTPLDGNSLFAPSTNDFYKTKNDACAQLTRPGSYCS